MGIFISLKFWDINCFFCALDYVRTKILVTVTNTGLTCTEFATNRNTGFAHTDYGIVIRRRQFYVV